MIDYKTIPLSSVQYYLLILSILTFPVNYKVFSIIRPLDISLFFLFTVTFLSRKIKIDKTMLFLLLTYFLVSFLSEFIGSLGSRKENLSMLGFYYKYVFIILIPLSLLHIKLSKLQYDNIMKILFYMYFSIVLWVLYYIYAVNNHIIVGSVRPSFPFSNDFKITDAHLLSSYLSIYLLIYLSYLRVLLRHNLMVSSAITLTSLFAILMSGSKTGALIVTVGFFLLLILGFVTSRFKGKFFFGVVAVAMFIFISAVFIFLLFEPGVDVNNKILYLFDRATTIDFKTDPSILARISKFNLSVSESEFGLYLFGVGFLFMEGNWYDGLVAHIISHSGFFGVIVFGVIVLYIQLSVMKYWKHSKYYVSVFTLIFIMFFIANLITEYFLVFRNYFPVSLFLTLLYKQLKEIKIYHDRLN